MNERLLNLYNEEKIFNLLNNKEEYSKLFHNKMDRHIKDIKLVDLLRIDALESFIIKNHNDKKYISLINKYTSFLLDEFKSNPFIIFDSILFNDKYINMFFNNNEVYKVNKFKKEIKERINSSLNSPKLPTTQIRFLISEIGNDKEKELLDKSYKYLIENIKCNNNDLAYEFIFKYSAYLTSKELNIDYYNVYLTKYDLYNNIYLDCYGKSYPIYGTVFVNKANSKKPDQLIYMIHTVCHEMRHIYQYDKYENENISKIAFDWMLYKIFSKNIENKDDKNYDNSEIEYDSNNFGWDFTYRLYSKYTNNDKIKKYSKRRQNIELLNKMINLKTKTTSLDLIDANEYNVKILDKLVLNNKDLLNKHYLLKYIYDKNGKRFSFEEMTHYENILLSGHLNEFKQLKEIYKPFYLSEINECININLNDYSRDKILLILNKLVDLAIEEVYEIKEIERLSNICGEDYKYRINRMIRLKLSRISNVIKYLNENSYIIHKNHSEILNAKINKLLILINNMNININNNFINNIIYKKNTYDMHISGYKLKKSVF